MRSHWTEIEKYLEDQKVAQELIGELRDFHMRYEVEDQVKERVEKPDILFYGKKILEMSIAALLQGDNLLLSGAKATGKNVLCETLAPSSTSFCACSSIGTYWLALLAASKKRVRSAPSRMHRRSSS